MFNVLRGQKRVQDKGPEDGLLGKTTQIKWIHLEEIWKTDIFKKYNTWFEFAYENQLFTENPNCAYGPYEHFLKDVTSNYDQKRQTVHGHSLFD